MIFQDTDIMMNVIKSQTERLLYVSQNKTFYEVEVKPSRKRLTPNSVLIIKLSSIEGYLHDQAEGSEMTRSQKDDKRVVLSQGEFPTFS
jgi:hypothetical protein